MENAVYCLHETIVSSSNLTAQYLVLTNQNACTIKFQKVIGCMKRIMQGWVLTEMVN